MKKLTASFFIVAFVFTVLAAPADAAIRINRNGYRSHNRVSLHKWQKSIKKQHNFAHIGNDVEVKTNSGENEAEENTGGDGDSVDVNSGEATTEVTIINNANRNVTMESDECDCACQEPAPDVTITNNGARSHNSAWLSANCFTKKEQHNVAFVHNDVDVKTNSGENEAEENTGGGVMVNSGSSSSTVSITNTVNHTISM